MRDRTRDVCSICLRGLLKLFNFLLAFVGVAIVLYSLWTLYKLSDYNLHGSHHSPHDLHIILGDWQLPSAWFVYFLLGLGVAICLITLIGHIAAETSNGCCLSSYMFFVILLVLLQGAFVADIFLNENWEEDFPADPTGLFESIKKFVKENIDVFKWVGLAIVITEALAVLLALCVQAVTPSSGWASYDSDDEYLLPRARLRQPLLIPNHAMDGTLPTNTGTVEGWPINR